MNIGPVILLVWFTVVGAAVLAGMIAVWKRGLTALGAGVLTILGAVFLYGFISAGLGISEGVWTFTSGGFLLMAGIGVAGLVLMGLGVCRLCHLPRRSELSPD